MGAGGFLLTNGQGLVLPIAQAALTGFAACEWNTRHSRVLGTNVVRHQRSEMARSERQSAVSRNSSSGVGRYRLRNQAGAWWLSTLMDPS